MIFILLLAVVQFSSLSCLNISHEFNVSGFGFSTGTASNSGHNDAVTLTLYWKYQILQCVIPENSGGNNKNFTCNTTSMSVIGTNDVEQYKMKIYYGHTSLFRPSGVHVIDNNGNKYIIDEFCGPIQYYYWDNSNPNPSQCIEYFTKQNRFRYDFLEIATNTAFLTTLYVTFIDNVLSYPNQALPGSVSPAKIHRFGVHTSLDENSANPLQDASLRLYWDTDLYLCSTRMPQYNTTYICDIADGSLKTHCYDDNIFINKSSNSSSFILMIENDDSDGIYIDHVFVIDESDYYYGIDTFCVTDSDILIGREGNLAVVCPGDSSLNKYDEICIDSDACGHNVRLAIEFGKDLFKNPNSDQESFVYPITQFNDISCDNTKTPTLTPTASPILPTVLFPSISPTEMPSMAPTQDVMVTSFGFKTHHYSNSGHNDDVILTLYWENQILQCIIASTNVADYNVYFMCDSSEMSVIAKELDTNQYKMKIYYGHSSLFRVSEIIVIDLDDNYYRVDTFCGADNFYYWDGTSDEEVLCNNYFPLKYNYSYIELATNTAYLTTIYVDFVNDILSHPNKNMSGELHPEYIKSFGFKTGSNVGRGEDVITMRLHWDTYRYQCSFVANQSDTLYLCDTNSKITLCDDDQIAAEFQIYIENNPSNQLQIAQLYVEDLSGYYYGVQAFCIESLNETNCTDGITYPAAISLSVQYILDVFLNPNDYKEGFVSINNNSLSNLTCAPTKDPTLAPTYNPAMMKISEFGITTHWYSNSGPDGDVTVTLYWENQIFECIISANKDAHTSDLSCNETEFTFIGYNEKTEFKMKLFYDHHNLFRPAALFVIDVFDNKYTINEFCGPHQYYYWDSADEFPCTEYYSDGNKYSYQYLELATNTAFLTTLYINFIEDVLSYPNVMLPGLVYPAQVVNFGLITSNDISAGTQGETASLRLYWDIYLYLCSLRISDPDTTYICDVSDTSQVKTHCVDELHPINGSLFELVIENDDTDGIYVDKIFVNDESGYYYGIDTFCVDNNNIEIGRTDEGQKCTDFSEYGSLSEFNDICIDRNNCGNDKIVSIVFSMNLFMNPNSDEQGYVFPVLELNTLQCSETDAPTTRPTATPTAPTIPVPSVSPTFMPTYTPTVVPKIKSFGFKTHYYSNSGHDSDVEITLWWMDQIFECIIPETNGTDYDEYFYCDDNKNAFRMIDQELSSNTFKMKLYYDHSSLFRVSEVIVVDVDNNRYIINTFCGAKEFDYWDGTDDDEVLCNDNSFPFKYNYSYIELATISAYLTTIYIDFVHDILSHPNQNMSGELHPEYIKSFGFKTGLDIFSGGDNESEVTVRLHWDTYRYQCSLIADKSDTLYLCDTANTKTVSCQDNWINPEFALFIENDHSDQLRIDQIYVEDLSGYYYGIEDFCVSSNISFAGRDWNGINCSLSDNVLEYDLLCIERGATCVESVNIQFFNNVFLNPKTLNEGLVLSGYTPLGDMVCLTRPPTYTPSLSPTYNPSLSLYSTKNEDGQINKDDGENKKNNLAWLWILLVILCITIVIAVVIWYIKCKRKTIADPQHYAMHSNASPVVSDGVVSDGVEMVGDGDTTMTVPADTNAIRMVEDDEDDDLLN